jgi:DNA-binding XRE family transcriptional regulator
MSVLGDIRAARRVLDLSQGKMASLLGVSVRAVQSYEQGWRVPTPAIEKLIGLLLYVHWRRTHPSPAPCWEVSGCPATTCARCVVKTYGAGDLCWMAAGAQCRNPLQDDWETTMARCSRCRVMTRWLPPAAPPAAPDSSASS